VADATAGVSRLALRTVGVAVLGALLLSTLVFRNIRRVAWSGLTSLVVTAATVGAAAVTARPESIAEPRYEGLLVNAPAVVGDARKIADNYGRYADQLRALVGNVSRVYAAVSTLPVYEPAADTTRVLHVSDLHLSPTAWPVIKTVVQQFNIDVIVDTGDITDWGSTAEAQYVSSIATLGVPYVYIRGNHDSQLTANAVAQQPNATVLDNSVATVAGLTIAGIGDPRFTPDKTNEPADGADAPTAVEAPETRSGTTLASTIRRSPTPVDLALVHDPASAGPLSGAAPIILAGHTHGRVVRLLERMPGSTSSRLMVQGSTGGAGLRGLQGDKPMPLALSVLYFDEKRLLKAYDDIAVGGTGQAQVTLERKVISDPNGEPTPTGSAGPLSGNGAAPTPTG
jgi:predicted MPP superfamily phosphohydrolase